MYIQCKYFLWNSMMLLFSILNSWKEVSWQCGLFFFFNPFSFSGNILKIMHSFNCFWVLWVFVAVYGLSLAVLSAGFSCGAWAPGSRLQKLQLAVSRTWAQYLWHTVLFALPDVDSSPTRDRIRVPSIGKKILNCCTIREVLTSFCLFVFLEDLRVLSFIWFSEFYRCNLNYSFSFYSAQYGSFSM